MTTQLDIMGFTNPTRRWGKIQFFQRHIRQGYNHLFNGASVRSRPALDIGSMQYSCILLHGGREQAQSMIGSLNPSCSSLMASTQFGDHKVNSFMSLASTRGSLIDRYLIQCASANDWEATGYAQSKHASPSRSSIFWTDLYEHLGSRPGL